MVNKSKFRFSIKTKGSERKLIDNTPNSALTNKTNNISSKKFSSRHPSKKGSMSFKEMVLQKNSISSSESEPSPRKFKNRKDSIKKISVKSRLSSMNATPL